VDVNFVGSGHLHSAPYHARRGWCQLASTRCPENKCWRGLCGRDVLGRSGGSTHYGAHGIDTDNNDSAGSGGGSGGGGGGSSRQVPAQKRRRIEMTEGLLRRAGIEALSPST
jgi:hypothetical protein